ncbi:MAG: NADH-quinone oxidoreductase subunit N [Deltaproteobacteria bacterium]|nr:NADH-quinone oxidoreductase subunit N [Deltaproteobacteria bacterium]
MHVLDNTASLWYFLPELLLSAVFVLLFVIDLPKSWSEKRLLTPIVAAIGLVAYMGLTAYSWDFPKAAAFHGMIIVDPFTNFFRIFSALTALVTIFYSLKAKELAMAGAEYWAILLGIVIGMPMLAASNNLLMIYLAMEIVSILSYIMVGYLPNSRRSVFLESNPAERLPLFVGLLMAFAGFGYKISAVPFHMWAPDVYEGAPTPVTAFLSVGPKAAGFGIVLRFIYTALTQHHGEEFVPLKYVDISSLLSLFAIATMVLGNLLAIQQKNIKRFLAYSSIAHAGYMLMAAAALNVMALQAILFYLLTYFIMNLGAFGVAILIQNDLGTEEIDGYKGLAKRGGRALWISIAMLMFLFSLTGLPPFIGFVGKFYLFAAVLDAKLYALALIGVLNSVVSLYYYARVVKVMFFDDPADERSLAKDSRGLSTLLFGLAAATVVFGLFWKSLALLSQSSANMMF